MLGDTVRRWRKERGWSQVELAARAGISQNHVSALEVGRLANPRGDTLEKLASAFGVTVDELYQDVRASAPPPATPSERLLAAFAELSPEEQEHIIFVVERIRRSRVASRIVE